MNLDINSKINGLFDHYQMHRRIREVEKRNERQILKSMQQCEMKPLTKGQVADIRANFKKYN